MFVRVKCVLVDISVPTALTTIRDPVGRSSTPRTSFRKRLGSSTHEKKAGGKGKRKVFESYKTHLLADTKVFGASSVECLVLTGQCPWV